LELAIRAELSLLPKQGHEHLLPDEIEGVTMRYMLCVGSVMAMLIVLACHNSAGHKPGGPYYFADWGGYQIPPKLYNEIPLDSAKTSRTYYEAFYDSQGRLTRVSKFLDRKTEWVDEYSYAPDGKTMTRIIRKADGSQVEQVYDQRGHLIISSR
jgi:hypothetical protein